MRRLLRSSGVKRENDRIDEGTSSVKPHWLGYVAQGGPPVVHPIVVVPREDTLRIVDQECENWHHPGPTAGVMLNVAHS